MKRITIVAMTLFLTLPACVPTDSSQAVRSVTPRYNSGELADKWRERHLQKGNTQVPVQPYMYPHDNDSEYYYPYQGGYGGAPYVPPSPRYYPQPYPQVSPYYYGNPYKPQAPLDFDGSNRYSYPRYDPEADNAPYGGGNSESYEYPLYFDE